MNAGNQRAVRLSTLGALGIALLLAVSVLAGCSSASAGGTTAASGGSLTTVTMVLTFPEGWESPIFYGLEKGVFKKDGINLQVSTPSGAEASTDINYISQGQFDAGYVGTYDIPIYQQKFGDNLVNVFGWAQQNPICWIVKKSAGITQPQQLAGKTLAIAKGSATSLIDAYFAHYGVPASKVNLETVAGSALPSLFLSGKAAAVAGYSFEEGPEFTAQNVPVSQLCLSQAGQQYEASGIAVSKSYLTSHKQTVANLVNALVTSFNDAKANPLAAAKAMTAKFGSQVSSAQVDMQETLALFQLMRTPSDNGQPYGWMSPQDMNQTISYDQKYYGLKPGYKGSFYTDEFFPKS